MRKNVCPKGKHALYKNNKTINAGLKKVRKEMEKVCSKANICVGSYQIDSCICLIEWDNENNN